MPILTYVTRVDVGPGAVLSGGTSYTENKALPAFFITGGFATTLYSTQHIALNSNYPDKTTESTRRYTAANTTINLSYTQDTTQRIVASIDSYGSTAVTYKSQKTEYNEYFENVANNATATTSYTHRYTQGFTEIEAFSTANNSLVYSVSRTSRGPDSVGLSSTVAGGGGAGPVSVTFSTSVSEGTTSSTSTTSSAGRFFKDSARLAVADTQNIAQNVTQRYVVSSSTRTHTLTYGGSITYTLTQTTSPAGGVTLTVTRTSTSFPGSQSVAITQRVPVTSTRATTRTISWSNTSGPHYHFSNNPQTVYGNLVVYDDLVTTGQRLACLPTAAGYQYFSQLSAVPAGYSTTFSFVYGQLGDSTLDQPAGTTGTITLVHDSYNSTGATASFVRTAAIAQFNPGSWFLIPLNFSEPRATLTPVTFTQTTGQTFAAQATSSTTIAGAGVSSTLRTSYGYVTASGATSLLTTFAKTLQEALGTTTSSRSMRLQGTTTTQATLSRSYTAGSTVLQSTGVGANTTYTSVAHGTVDRAFHVRTISFSEHAPDVPAYRFSQQVLIGAFIHAGSATHVYNTMDTALMFSLSSFAANDGAIGSQPIGFIPLSGSTLHSDSVYTQAYSSSSNSTSLSFTYRATSADASATLTSSHVKTMGNSAARVTIHNNNFTAAMDTTTVRSFPSGTGGAYSTGGSEAARFEAPSFVPSAIHATVGLNGTASYNLEHDLVYGSGTAGSIRNAGTSASTFPVSRSMASQRIFFGNQITGAAPAFSDCAPFITEITINPMATVAPL